jgi:hypothetical protein
MPALVGGGLPALRRQVQPREGSHARNCLEPGYQLKAFLTVPRHGSSQRPAVAAAHGPEKGHRSKVEDVYEAIKPQ